MAVDSDGGIIAEIGVRRDPVQSIRLS